VKLRWHRVGGVTYFLLFTAAVTWPLYVPFNRIEPYVLGLPFSMVWVACWLLCSAGVLYLVDRAESRERRG
jgi:hypothetical protein